MTISQLDVAIRAGAAGAILLLGWLLLTNRRQIGPPAVLFAPLALCITGFVIGNTPISALRPGGVLGTLAHTISGFTVVFLWWFSLSCFDSRFRVNGGVLGVGLLWTAIAAMNRGLVGDGLADLGLSRLLVPMGFAIVGHLVWRLLAERAGDLIPQRHDARVMVAVLLGGMLLIDLAADALFGFAWRPLAFALAQNAMILAFGLWLMGTLLTVRADALSFGATDMAQATAGTSSRPGQWRDTALHHRLSVLMETERVFLDPELTFTTFVERMHAPERVVRSMIHLELGFDHFRTFLNHHRIAEARRLLADQDRADKLINVALDSGFASLASFNRVFRAIEGCTPSAYRAAARQSARGSAETTRAAF